jgi:hypothetical protein
LETAGYQFLSPLKTTRRNWKDHNVSQSIRTGTSTYNVLRSTLQRARTLFMQTTRFFFTDTPFHLWLKGVDVYVRPTVNVLVLLFFLPRLVNNLIFLIKHSVLNPWMDPRLKRVRFTERLALQWERRGFEILDDLGWFLSSVALCLLWTGSWIPFAFTASLFQRSFEVSCRIAKTMIRLGPMQQMQKEYQQMLASLEISEDEKQSLAAYLEILNLRIAFERRKLIVDILNSATILTTVIMLIPLVPFSPWIPFMGAVVALVATGIFYGIGKYQEKHHPTKKQDVTAKVSRLGWFARKDATPEPTDCNQPVVPNAM